MVRFDFNKPIGERQWTAIIDGDTDDYIYTLHSLLEVLGAQQQDFICRDNNYMVLNFIKQLLPEPEQLKP